MRTLKNLTIKAAAVALTMATVAALVALCGAIAGPAAVPVATVVFGGAAGQWLKSELFAA